MQLSAYCTWELQWIKFGQLQSSWSARCWMGHGVLVRGMDNLCQKNVNLQDFVWFVTNNAFSVSYFALPDLSPWSILWKLSAINCCGRNDIIAGISSSNAFSNARTSDVTLYEPISANSVILVKSFCTIP